MTHNAKSQAKGHQSNCTVVLGDGARALRAHLGSRGTLPPSHPPQPARPRLGQLVLHQLLRVQVHLPRHLVPRAKVHLLRLLGVRRRVPRPPALRGGILAAAQVLQVVGARVRVRLRARVRVRVRVRVWARVRVWVWVRVRVRMRARARVRNRFGVWLLTSGQLAMPPLAGLHVVVHQAAETPFRPTGSGALSYFVNPTA